MKKRFLLIFFIGLLGVPSLALANTIEQTKPSAHSISCISSLLGQAPELSALISEQLKLVKNLELLEKNTNKEARQLLAEKKATNWVNLVSLWGNRHIRRARNKRLGTLIKKEKVIQRRKEKFKILLNEYFHELFKQDVETNRLTTLYLQSRLTLGTLAESEQKTKKARKHSLIRSALLAVSSLSFTSAVSFISLVHYVFYMRPSQNHFFKINQKVFDDYKRLQDLKGETTNTEATPIDINSNQYFHQGLTESLNSVYDLFMPSSVQLYSPWMFDQIAAFNLILTAINLRAIQNDLKTKRSLTLELKKAHEELELQIKDLLCMANEYCAINSGQPNFDFYKLEI